MKLSVVTTMYYSRNYLHEFYFKTLTAIRELGLSTYEIIFVDDGSPDDSLQVALELQKSDSNIRIVELSRNFGHQRAIMTGLQNSTGDYVFLIDCDLEEDPTHLKVLWKSLQANEGVDVVYGVQPRRKGGWFERTSGKLFYKVLSYLSSVEYPADTLTSRVMSRRYIEAVKKYSEKEIDVWGVFVMAGFNQQSVFLAKGSKGTSTYTFTRKLRQSIEIITSISHRPLYITFFLGLLLFLLAMISIGVIVYKKYLLNQQVEGWASILASIWLVGGMILLMLGVFGIYLSKMFLEIKNRPLTIIKHVHTR